MRRLKTIALAVLHNFGGLILFWLVMWRFGLKPAIAVTLAFVVIDGARRLIWRVKTPKVYVLANGLALVFGLIDLHARSPFMIRYEGVISYCVGAAFFTIGAFGRRPIIQEFAEQSRGGPFPLERTELHGYFVAFTLFWAVYFAAMAAFCLVVVAVLPLKQALAVRSVAGLASFAVMLLISFRARQVLVLLQRAGLFLPKPPASARADAAGEASS